MTSKKTTTLRYELLRTTRGQRYFLFPMGYSPRMRGVGMCSERSYGEPSRTDGCLEQLGRSCTKWLPQFANRWVVPTPSWMKPLIVYSEPFLQRRFAFLGRWMLA